jgi:hypothetical protein
MRKGGIAFGLCLAAALALPGLAHAKDCVRAVRSMSDFTIQGDAWTWWQHSQGVYDHDNRPQAGSVLVFKRTGQLGRGHVSLVSAVVDNRTIEVDHTWLRSPEIRRSMTVIDVSPDNDWSEVRVWNEPTDQLGTRIYPTYGFVLPAGGTGSGEVAIASAEDEVPVAPRRGAKASGKTLQVAAKPAKGKTALSKASARVTSNRHRDATVAVLAKGRTPAKKPAAAETAAHKEPARAKDSVGAALPKAKPHRQVASSK